MKRILRIILIEIAGLYVVSQIAQGLVFDQVPEAVLITGVALGIAMFLIKPIINILLLPLTLATMGILKVLGHTITLYIVDVALPQFHIEGFNFPGLTTQYLDIPPIVFQKGALAYLAFSILIWFITGMINWLRK